MTSNSESVRTVYLVRHTQTNWNTQSRYQGRLDSQLSAQGRTDVGRIASMVQIGDFDVAFSSPLSRARILAQAMSEASGCSIHFDDRLTEIGMGEWEGLHKDEIIERFPDLFATWQTDSDAVTFPGGESLLDVAARVQAFADEVYNSSDSRVLVVSHDAVIKVFLMLSLGLSLKHLHRFRMRNGSVSILRGPRFVGAVETIDSTGHLTGSPFRV